MKKILVSMAVLLSLPFIMNAQRVEITPFGGYVFAGTMYGTNGNAWIQDNAQYGGIISFGVSRSVDIDLLYNRSDTKCDITYTGTYYNNLSYETVPLSINYMHVGFTKNFRVNPMVSPFFGLNLGACDFAPKNNYSDQWFFSMGLNAGAKIYFSKVIGLRLQAQGMMPLQGTAFSMFVGTGGSGGGLSVYSTLFQFGFTGGLIFRIGKTP